MNTPAKVGTAGDMKAAGDFKVLYLPTIPGWFLILSFDFDF